MYGAGGGYGATPYAAAGAGEPPVVLLSDDFNRAASSSVVGSPQIGPAPVIQVGTWGITSTGRLYVAAVSSGRAILTWDLGATTTYDFQTTLIYSASGVTGLIFGSATNDYWGAYTQPGSVLRFGRLTPSPVSIASSLELTKAVYASGDTVRVQYRNGYIRGAINGVFGPWLDVSHYWSPVGNLVGLFVTTNNPTFDNLSVQTVIDAPAPRASIGHIYKGRDTKAADMAAVA